MLTQVASSARERNTSFLKILLTWVAAVCSEIESSAATWRLVSPRATRSATSCSRAVSLSVGSSCGDCCSGSSEERGSILLLFFREGILDGLIQGHGFPLLPLLLPGGLLKPGASRFYVRLDHRALLWYPRSAGGLAKLRRSRPTAAPPCGSLPSKRRRPATTSRAKSTPRCLSQLL